MQLREGGEDGTIHRVCPGEQLTASLAGDTQTLTSIDNRTRYRTVFGHDESDAEVKVSFSRKENEDASNSVVVLPLTCQVWLAESMGTQVVRGNNIYVEWDPSGLEEDILWYVDGICVGSTNGQTPDDGSFTLGTQHVQVAEGSEGAECDVTITLERNAEGTVDSQFGQGGTITAQRQCSTTYLSLPKATETDR